MLDGRAKKLAAAMPDGFEAALIGTEPNRFYLLDFDAGDAGTLLVLPDKMVYIIDSRYIEIAQKQVRGAEIVLQEDVMAQLGEQLKKAGVKRLHLEDSASIASMNELHEKFPGVELISDNTLRKTLNNLRLIKDEEEIRRMREAQRITDSAFTHILGVLKEGMREVEIALELETYMRSHGADGLAFETIAVCGPNSSLPHGVPGDNRLKKGDLLTMDYGAKYKGYCSDMTRTVAFGEPDEEQRRVYETVLKAHLAGIEAAAGGKTGVEVDKAARDIIDGAGYKGKFGHGLGHAVGIDIHEDPRFSPKCTDVVPAGSIMTVEPGIYLEGRFGCRIEDMVLMTETGCEPMPTSKKELIVL